MLQLSQPVRMSILLVEIAPLRVGKWRVDFTKMVRDASAQVDFHDSYGIHQR